MAKAVAGAEPSNDRALPGEVGYVSSESVDANVQGVGAVGATETAGETPPVPEPAPEPVSPVPSPVTPARGPSGRRPDAAPVAEPVKDETEEARAWASSQGIAIPAGDTVPEWIVEAYKEEQAKK